MKLRLIRVCAFMVIFARTLALPVSAQVPTGTINGRVTDPGGAVVVGAQIAALNQSTNVSREMVTNADGLYVLSDLTPGTYTISITASGFSTSEFKDVILQAGRASAVDAKLKVASVGTSVTSRRRPARSS
jgi:carboxypeptidase family protein